MPKGIRKSLEEKEAERIAKEEAKAAKKAAKEMAKLAIEPELAEEPDGEKTEGGLEVPEDAKIEVNDTPKFDPDAKVDVCNRHDVANYYVRTYSEERHGKDYLDKAHELARNKGYVVLGHDKARIPGYRLGTPAHDEVLGLEK